MKAPLLSEIFGPTIQGEGRFIGCPTIFVRTAGCDYRCSWCDSMFAVDPQKYHDDWEFHEDEDIVRQVMALANNSTIRPTVTFSGGNPAIQPLGRAIDLLEEQRFHTIIETQATIIPDWIASPSAFSFSPKPPSSKMDADPQDLAEWLIELRKANPVSYERSQVKIVVMDEEDWEWAKMVKDTVHADDLPFYVQPCNPWVGADEQGMAVPLLRAYESLIARVLQDGRYDFGVLPQLHTLVWGNERGR